MVFPSQRQTQLNKRITEKLRDGKREREKCAERKETEQVKLTEMDSGKQTEIDTERQRCGRCGELRGESGEGSRDGVE